MRNLWKVVALMTVLLFTASSAWALSYNNHVSVAPNGKGDAIIYPVYLAIDGFQTKLQVINTYANASAIAKVVVRSPEHSQEVLDFYIFLTPTDVWEGYLMWDGDQVIMVSGDDSIIASPIEPLEHPVFATEDDPFVEPLRGGCVDEFRWGYVEVKLAYVFNEDGRDIDGKRVNLTRAPVTKLDLYAAFVGDGVVANHHNLGGNILSPIQYGAGQAWRTLGSNPQRIDGSRAPGGFPALLNVGYPNMLAGNLQIQEPLLGWNSALNATVLKDYRVSDLLPLQQESVWGVRAENNIVEVDAALAINDIGMPFVFDHPGEGATLHFFTFPTKNTRLDGACRIANWMGTYAGFRGAGLYSVDQDPNNLDRFRWESVGIRLTGVALYDQLETVSPFTTVSPFDAVATTFNWEVNFVILESTRIPLTKGWMRYLFPDGGPELGQDGFSPRLYTQPPFQPNAPNGQRYRTPIDYPRQNLNRPTPQPLRYTAAPVIPVSINFGMGMSAMHGFYDDGDVWGACAPGVPGPNNDGWCVYPGYSYLNSATPAS